MATASEKRVLVVDDEPDVRNFLAACIEDAGFSVETAVDGVDALEKLKASPPDLMTLYLHMPRQSGIRVMRTMRQNDEWSKIPVIVITAHARDEFGRDDLKEFKAFASGLRPRYTMEKPITPEGLVKAVCEILDVSVEVKKVEPSEADAIRNLISNADPDTLAKIKGLLRRN
jgi:CheY-like chemotaxis protein